MPQEVSTREGKSDQPWSMDANANRLMDDIFADVERILESGSETPIVPDEPAEYVSFPQVAVPSVTIPAEITPRPAVEEENIKPEKTQKGQQSGKSLETWLLIAACASLGITLLLWVLGQSRLNSLLGNNSASNPKATQSTQRDLAFVDYMQRSLESIDQKAEERKQVAVVPPAPQPTQLPLPVLTPGNLPQNSNRPNVLERVYIPVYPQPRIVYTNPASPAATTSPQAAAPSPATSTANASPTPKATSTAQASPTSAASSKPEARQTSRPVGKAPTVPKLSAALPNQTTSPTTKPTTAATKPAASPTQAASESPRVAAVPSSPTAQPTFRNRSTQATASTPANQNSLRGVLVLGNRSAAIFEIGGVPQRIYVGESIGSSGWTLVEINNENSEAVIRKNGEVRSIFVGQQF